MKDIPQPQKNWLSLSDFFWLSTFFVVGIYLFSKILLGETTLFFYVLLQIAAALTFVFVLKKWENGSVPFFEIGFFYVVVILSYSIIPLTFQILAPDNYSLLQDWRISGSQDSLHEAALFFSLYLIAFCASYLLFRRKLPQVRIRLPRMGTATLFVIIGAILFIEAFFVILEQIYMVPRAETYSETYLVYSHLPLILRQSTNHLGKILITLKIFLLVLLFQRYKKTRFLVLAWIGFEFLAVFGRIKARNEFLVLLLSCIIIYHFIVKPLRPRTIICIGLAFLLVFIAMGLARGQALLPFKDPVDKLWGGTTEFRVLFGNILDVSYLKKHDYIKDVSSASFYLSDFFVFIPQQLLPFHKIDLVRWYIQTYYPEMAGVGGGLAFGAIPESILGLGMIEMFIRAAVLGCIFALIYRSYTRRQEGFYYFAFYVWLVVNSYISFRTGTFAIIPRFIYQFLIPVIIIIFITKVIESAVFRDKQEV